MKCPKCSYLGFETGDRCKNCGYDFSLLATPSPAIDPDLVIREPREPHAAPDLWLDRVDTSLSGASTRPSAETTVAAAVATTVITPPAAAAPRDLSFPLFLPENEQDDEPLIKLPASPRPPLAVRRTPDMPRLRPTGRLADAGDGRLVLEASDPVPFLRSDRPAAPEVRRPARAVRVSGLPRRIAAGVIDLAILLGVDALVLYSTLRMASLTMADWGALPPVPMLAFIVLLKLAYFGAFTAACGQTIGKMAMRIRVVADDMPLDPARAAQRTLVSAVSVLALGAGFIPMFVDPNRRALHDRVAGTRVVEVPTA
jgi:uncharacterized RDD family membrane protein YckC